MKSIFCSIILIALASCGPGGSASVNPEDPNLTPIATPTPSPTATPMPLPTFKGDQSFMPYIIRFVSEANSMGKAVSTATLTILFSDLAGYGSSVIGLCTGRNTPKQTVLFKKSWWANASEERRMMIVRHELGHCVPELFRPHKTLKVGTRPASIMYPVIVSSSNFAKYTEAYLHELFHGDDSGEEEVGNTIICDERVGI